MLITTIFFALFTDEKFGGEAGAVCGMLLDIFSIRFFGLNTILFALGGYIIGKYNSKVYRDSVITHIIITFVASFFILSSSLFIINLRSSAFRMRAESALFFNSAIFTLSFLNSFLAIWIYAFLSSLFKLSES